MRREEIAALCRILTELEVKFILVGGLSVEVAGYSIGTDDADFTLGTGDFEVTLEKLEAHERFRAIESLGSIGGGEFFTGGRWVDVDFIRPGLFRGKMTSDQFIDYIRRYRAIDTDLGPVARPEVAWYMRLVVPDWEIYVQKIVRDVRAGVPEELLDAAGAIARKMGRGAMIHERIKKVRQYIEMTGRDG